MKIRAYVNDIFPADIEIDDQTGVILDGPNLTKHWLNHEKLSWFFELIATIKAAGFEIYGQEPVFVCRIARKDKKKLEQMGLTIKGSGNL